MAGPQAGYCHFKGHLHNWGHMLHFCDRSSCIFSYSTPSRTSIFSILLSGFSRGLAMISGAPGRLLTTAASNRNYELKKVTIIQCSFIWFNAL